MKFKVTVHDESGHEQDMTMGAKEAAELVAAGKVSHLAEDKPVNILELRWELGVWTIVVFLLLLFILRKAAWGPMLEGLQKREQNIRSALEEAELARKEARELQGKLKQEMDRAAEKVREILEEARRDAQYTADEMVAKARAEIQTDRDRLRREIETARDQALKELWSQTAQLATLVSAKAIKRQLSPDDHRRLVDEALADLRTAGDQRQREIVR